jgi:hypothetical protein
MAKTEIDYTDDLLLDFHNKPYNDIVAVAEARRVRRKRQFDLWLAGKVESHLSLR